MKRQSLNLILTGLALALGGTILLSGKKDAKKDPLTALHGDQINHIQLEHAGRPTIELSRNQGHWQLTQPVNTAAEPLAISALLALAATPVRSHLDLGSVKLADIGLEPPLLTVKLDGTTVAFGGTEPLKYSRYVEVTPAGGKPQLALIDDLNGPAFDDDYSDLASKSLLPDGAAVLRIELPGLSVAQAADGKSWTAEPAVSDRDAVALQADLQHFVDHWQHVQAMWVQAMPADAPPGQPLALVTAKGGRVLRIAAREPQLLLDDPSLKLRYALSKEYADTLLKLPPPESAKSETPATSTTTPAASEAPAAPAAAAPASTPAPRPTPSPTPSADAAAPH